DVEPVHLSEDVDFAAHRRALTQAHGDDDAALAVELGGLPEVIDAIEVAELRRVARRHACEFFLELEPHGQRKNANIFTGQAGEEELAAVLRLEERTEDVGHLESSFVIDAGRRVTPKHPTPRLSPHFFPQNSTQILEEGRFVVNAKSTPSVTYV